MGDLSANSCGCGNNSCTWIIILILLFACCGNDNGNGIFGGNDNGCGNGNGGCTIAIIIILLLFCCGGNNNGISNGCGCGC